MMHCIKVGAGALNQTPLDWEGNLAHIQEIILEAESQGVQILCLPELCITGYGCEDAFLAMDVPDRALQMLAKLAGYSRRLILCVGLPIVYRNALYNCIALLNHGRLMGLVAKQHLAGDGIHYEPRWFKPWPAGKRGVVTLELGDRYEEVPIGDLCFDIGGVRLGFEICEDAWVAERPGAHLARKGVDIILNPSASHFSFGKHEIRKRFVTEGSRAFSATYVYANLLGNEAGRAIYDGECLIATGGKIVAHGKRFSMDTSVLTTAVVDLSLTRTQQIGSASFSPEFDNTSWVTSLESLAGLYATPDGGEGEKTFSKPEEFTLASTLGLFDYLRKSHSKGFVISLSGGADSAACAFLVSLMISRGTKELGVAKFCEKVGFPYPSNGTVNYGVLEASIRRRMLTCVYQSTSNSSETTLTAAQAVAADVGATFHTIDIDALVKAYTSLVAVALQHEFSWENDDITLQNIQARTRAPGVWMIANVQNKLLITTSNRSEAAVGYCTMDGDTAGSIAPLGGIDKTFLLEWLQSLQLSQDLRKDGLLLVLAQSPTAELRPGESQTDEKDLMPYTILNFIENRALLDRMCPMDVYLSLQDFLAKVPAGIPRETHPQVVYRYVEKFYQLWCRNQWKRERYALSFHVDDKNLDPRSWCRFPVLSGGYTVELRELRKMVGLG
jgi:NAD+ synthase (glutamine-hydrolysing)